MEYTFTTRLIDIKALEKILDETMVQAYQINYENAKNAEDIWKLGLDPNHLTAFITIPEIKK